MNRSPNRSVTRALAPLRPLASAVAFAALAGACTG